MLRFAVIPLCLALAAIAAAAQAAAGPQRQPQQQVERIFAQWGKQTPGCVIGVAQGGKHLLTRAFGMADLEHGIANGADTVFEAGSVSKQFTAAALALLARDGKLSLDDQVRTYLPELPDYGSALTIRQMLEHTSGLRDWGALAEIAGWPRGTRVYTQRMMLDIASAQRSLNFTPGTAWSYSNTGYSLAVLIVERVSGQSFSAFTRARIFAPLGMDHSSWRDDYSRVVPRRAVAYRPAGGGYRADMPFENVIGSGGMLTTVGDLLKWNENFVKPLVGDARFAADAQTPGVFTNGKAHDYGLGLVVGAPRGVPKVSHGGATAGYRSTLDRYPTQHLSVAVLCNAANANPGSDAAAVAQLYLAGPADGGVAALPRPASMPPLFAPDSAAGPAQGSAELAELAGTYRSAEADAMYTVAVENGKLVARGRSGDALPLAGEAADRFRAGPVRVLFRRDARGKVEGLSVAADRVWDLRFEKQQ
ncbi:MAG: serine hydrolase domain-containing protein [Telluria sp.]